ncbi:MAG: transcription/translation regulatory transformer protein RfaH [Betaproteobacteria bacterium]|nr:transcription/translation regulatory transformer protein RfaH [Betaproteobacteria bacterium]
MHWYVVHTKPRQEERALLNLERQGYTCFLPRFPSERLRQGQLSVSDVPLFPRYLFLGLKPDCSGLSPVRSTQGVSRLVAFGTEPARVDPDLIETLRSRAAVALHTLFEPGERVQITQGPFAGIDAVFQMNDGESRVRVLIELLSKPAVLKVSPAALRKV